MTTDRSEPPDEPPALARQRWRLVLSRDADAPPLGGRELGDAFERSMETTALPLFRPSGRARGRVAFGAPLQVGIAAERELADIILTELVPRSVVRDRIADSLPGGWHLVDLFDVWLGAPPLAGQVVAADYRIAFEETDVAALTVACAGLLAATALPRERAKGTAVVTYDLRPLLVDVQVVDARPPVRVRARTRFDPALGTGRPEEVVASLADRLGRALEVVSVVRERLIVADDPA